MFDKSRDEGIRKKSLRDFHKTHPSGSGTVAEKPPSVKKITPTVTSERTGDKPGVPDVTNDNSSESESESWGNDEDDSNNEQESSDESSKQENESEGQESNLKQDEESDDDDQEEEEFDQESESEDDEMKNATLEEPTETATGIVQGEGNDTEMTEAQQGNENLETTQEQVVEDAYVTISIVLKKTEVPVTSSSRSSDLGRDFDALPSEEDTISFLRDLDHTRVINSLNDVVVDHMHQPWRTFVALINRSLSGKTSALDKLRLSHAQILWGMYHQKYVDYVELLWEDFTYQIDNKVYKKQENMYYPRFTKVIIHHFLIQDKTLSWRNKIGMHTSKDDYLINTLRFVSRKEASQIYGAVLPDYEEPVQKGKRVKRSAKKSSTTPATGIVIRETPVKTKSIGKEKVDVPRVKGIELLSEVALAKKAQLKEVRKKSLRDFHRTHPNGSGVPDMTKDDSSESESESWGNDEDDSNDESDAASEHSDEENESDEDETQSDNEEGSDSKHETKENESDSEKEDVKDDDEKEEEFIHTPSQSDDENDDEIEG
ncbi:hypothetical protein Tco_0846991, partial [Tanacetum coccineum]